MAELEASSGEALLTSRRAVICLRRRSKQGALKRRRHFEPKETIRRISVVLTAFINYA